ncbi:hypothetical protein BRW65_16990 [Mycobacterium paraffinicum]|uniref:Aldehyde dehydrogenase domain-containing protein n=1 Tax=Mycobacterium paraffinicum TaxID=53378 RepID=A0A1Q4HSI4_9MYCO|nr:hypothetical protein BRW65_16990 [Mycobacterium paraffinicum]
MPAQDTAEPTATIADAAPASRVDRRLLIASWPADVFSRDQGRALAVARRIRTGSFSINGGNYFGADSPFGGFKQSGVGRGMGVPGLEEFLERKTYAVPSLGAPA